MNHFSKVGFTARAAAGKSECLAAIRAMPPELRTERLHMGREVVELDDFPYVHLMREIDKAQAKLGLPFLFFIALDDLFLEPDKSWKLLILLLNEDHEDLVVKLQPRSASDPVRSMLMRYDAARMKLGAMPMFFTSDGHPIMGREKYGLFERELADAFIKVIGKRNKQVPKDPENTTVLFEFARGGLVGAEKPLQWGYNDSYQAISSSILDELVLLNLHVLAIQSVLKNVARCDPSDPGSILGHSVPYKVMVHNYSSCDFQYMLDLPDSPNGHIRVKPMDGGRAIDIPAAVFDNTTDYTSFVRDCTKEEDPKPWEEWPKKERNALVEALAEPCGKLWETHSSHTGGKWL